MRLSNIPIRLLFTGLVAMSLVQPAHAAGDPRKILCAWPCTLTMKAGVGTIDVKVPLASGTLKTLYREGDSFELEGGKDYVLVFKESKDGLFSFDLRFAAKAGDSVWSCRVKTIPTEPYISVEQTAWSGTPGQVAINTDRVKPFIVIKNHS